ncbi:MAG TPA: hypothetical protein VND93_27365 [Myxococcales bacterium]|nr:hypothetical protein [Myxococcales bacterium]
MAELRAELKAEVRAIKKTLDDTVAISQRTHDIVTELVYAISLSDHEQRIQALERAVGMAKRH